VLVKRFKSAGGELRLQSGVARIVFDVMALRGGELTTVK
jgi:hypothetical protein